MRTWLALGTALAIIWAIAAGAYQRVSDLQHAKDFGDFSRRVCLQSNAVNQINDIASCDKDGQDSAATMMAGSWGNVAFLALAPIPVGWFSAFILINAGRIFVAGFRVVVPWSSLGRLKRAFVVLSLLICAATFILASVVIMNLYVDTQVPVALGYKAMVTVTGDFVTARGTWTRSGQTDADKMGYPLQASKIECYKPDNKCEEARASVSGTLMSAELEEYNVESWSDTTIVFKADTPCATEEYTIDLKTQSVNGVGHRINKDKDFCKSPFGENSSGNWTYHLADGFSVYWEQRNRARPIPLRVFQAIFGN